MSALFRRLPVRSGIACTQFLCEGCRIGSEVFFVHNISSLTDDERHHARRSILGGIRHQSQAYPLLAAGNIATPPRWRICTLYSVVLTGVETRLVGVATGCTDREKALILRANRVIV